MILFPLNREGGGTGHFRRCWNLSRSWNGESLMLLDTLGEGADAEHARSAREWADLVPGFPGNTRLMNLSEFLDPQISEPSQAGFLDSIALVDQRSASLEQLRILAEHAMPLLLDDNGPARKYAPFLLDTLPGPRRTDANVSSPAYLDLPPLSREPDSRSAILVSFGGEDPARLSLAVVNSLVHQAEIAPERISVVLSPGDIEFIAGGNGDESVSAAVPTGVRILKPAENLKNRLAEFGLVICSYGLTVWESLASGASVLCVEPGAYHYSLSRKARIPSAGYVRRAGRWKKMNNGRRAPGDSINSAGVSAVLPFPVRRRFLRLLKNPSFLDASARKLGAALNERKSLRLLVEKLDAPAPRCTACGYLLPPVIERFPDRSYYRCPRCTITGLYRFYRRENEYGTSYFHEEYRRQYGKSYLEDWNSIKALCIPRLKILQSRLSAGSRVLDIGCAYGVFLEAAQEAGLEALGCDISDEAVSYVRTNLKIPAYTAAFPQEGSASPFGFSHFDAITLWYVIEHFPELESVLEKLTNMLESGGILAFSTPNGRGISGRKNRKQFLFESPRDHYSIWNPRVARKLLARYGLKVYRIRVTGHHPERFGKFAPKAGIVHKVLGILSRLLRLGDTFEVYAVKGTRISPDQTAEEFGVV